jgi:hypothetical protein
MWLQASLCIAPGVCLLQFIEEWISLFRGYAYLQIQQVKPKSIENTYNIGTQIIDV